MTDDIAPVGPIFVGMDFATEPSATGIRMQCSCGTVTFLTWQEPTPLPFDMTCDNCGFVVRVHA